MHRVSYYINPERCGNIIIPVPDMLDMRYPQVASYLTFEKRHQPLVYAAATFIYSHQDFGQEN
jgi:hypothetical protein